MIAPLTLAAVLMCAAVLASVVTSAFSPSRVLFAPIGLVVAGATAALLIAGLRSWGRCRPMLLRRYEAVLALYVAALLLLGFAFAVQGTVAFDEQTVWVPSARVIATYLTYPAISAANEVPRQRPPKTSIDSPASVFAYTLQTYGPTWPHTLALAWLTLPFLTHVLPMLVYGLGTAAAVEILAPFVPSGSRWTFLLLALGAALLAAPNEYPFVPQSNFPAAGLAALFTALVVAAVIAGRPDGVNAGGATSFWSRRSWGLLPLLCVAGLLLFWSRPEAKVVMVFVVAPFFLAGVAGMIRGARAPGRFNDGAKSAVLLLGITGAVIVLAHLVYQLRVISVGFPVESNWFQRWFNEFPLSRMQLWGPKISTGLAVWVGDTTSWPAALARYAWPNWLELHDPIAPLFVWVLLAAAAIAWWRGRRPAECAAALAAGGALVVAYAVLFVLIVNTVNLPSLHRYEAVASTPAAMMAAFAWASVLPPEPAYGTAGGGGRRLLAAAAVVLAAGLGFQYVATAPDRADRAEAARARLEMPRLAQGIRAYYTAHGCYPPAPRSAIGKAFGVAPGGAAPYLGGPWPARVAYGTFAPGGQMITDAGRAAYVGIVERRDWIAHGRGNTNAGYVWIVNDAQVAVCEPPQLAAARAAAERLVVERAAARAATERLVAPVRAYQVLHGCYPPVPWTRVSDGFGVAPVGVGGSWPSDQLYGAFTRGGTPVTDTGTAYYVGLVSRTAWQARGGGNTNAGYVWIVNNTPAAVCENPRLAVARTATRQAVAAVRAYYAAHRCYPPIPWTSVSDGFGVAPDGAVGPWPPDQLYGAFARSGAPVTDTGTAYNVGVVSRTEWQRHGGGNTNAGYAWIVNNAPVAVCENPRLAAERAATARLVQVVRAYYAAHRCYPPTPWTGASDGFGVAPGRIGGPWPSDQRYGAFDAGGNPITGAGTAYYVGVVSRTDWQAHGGGNTNSGYAWVANGHPVPVCRP